MLALHRALGGADDLRCPEEVQAVPDVEEPDDHVQPPVGRPPQLARQPQVDQAKAVTPNAGEEEGEREKQRVGVVSLARTLAGRLEEPEGQRGGAAVRDGKGGGEGRCAPLTLGGRASSAWESAAPAFV